MDTEAIVDSLVTVVVAGALLPIAFTFVVFQLWDAPALHKWMLAAAKAFAGGLGVAMLSYLTDDKATIALFAAAIGFTIYTAEIGSEWAFAKVHHTARTARAETTQHRAARRIAAEVVDLIGHARFREQQGREPFWAYVEVASEERVLLDVTDARIVSRPHGGSVQPAPLARS